MKIHSKLVLAGLLALAALFSLALLGARAEAASEAVITLSADQAEFAADQPVVVQVTVSNPTNHTLHILKWYTPADGVEEPLFAARRDGAAVGYTGAIYKRPQATGADYLKLKAGESQTYSVVLDEVYDLSVSGDYTFQYDVASSYLSSEKGGRYESLTSNALALKVDGRDKKRPGGGATCTTTQLSTLASAKAQALTYSTGALSYLTANTLNSRYTTWFGVFSSSRYNAVTSNFAAIENAFDTKDVVFDCSCKKRYYAYVYPNDAYKIYVCSVFWTAPLTGTDSKAGTLIHEMSHFYVVASTDDYVYGQSGAKSLAISDPDLAVDNADNHEYFAENTPVLP